MVKAARIDVRLPQRLKDVLLRESGAANLSLNAYIVRVIRNRRRYRRRPVHKEA
jgi:predicted HicB family RNase H-like nuclease